MSAALTFHLLLWLLDRAPALRRIAEMYEERSVDEQERAAVRRARRARIKTGTPPQTNRRTSTSVSTTTAAEFGNGRVGSPMAERHQSNGHDRGANRGRATSAAGTAEREVREDELRRRVRAAIHNGEPVTGETVGQWLGLSARTGRRRLAALLTTDPDLAQAVD